MSYRAPELINEEVGEFTNKVDIWAMGCILYELAVGKKAFRSDWSVLELRQSRTKFTVMLDDTFDDEGKHYLSQHISSMLEIDPFSRPAASALVSDFCLHCEPSNFPISQRCEQIVPKPRQESLATDNNLLIQRG